jgi:HK97 family phage prohead protease
MKRDYLEVPKSPVVSVRWDPVGEEKAAIEGMKAIFADMRQKARELRARSEARMEQGEECGCKSFTCVFEVKTDGLQPFEFEGYASIYGGLPDAQGDVVDPGAFASASSELPLLFNHDPDQVIGKVVLTDSPHGLMVRGQLNPGVARAKEIWSLLMQRAITGLSIGYNVVRQVYKDGARHLQEIQLHEVSVTPFPAQPLATVSAVKK